MAKFTSSIEDMFAAPKQKESSQITAEKSYTIKKKYNYGKKVNIFIDEEVWEDVLIYLQIKQLKQTAFFNELVLSVVRENEELIDKYKTVVRK